MDWRSPLFDLILIAMAFSVVKTYVFEKGLSDFEERFIKHSNRWIRYIAVLIIFCSTLYVVGVDIEVANEEYYMFGLVLTYTTMYIGALWSIYVDYRYGPKNHCFVEDVKLRIRAAIVIPCLFLLLHFLAG